MPKYVEEKKEVEVPPATGIPGFLKVIEGILELPRVQEVVLAKDKISYRRFRREDEGERPLDISLDSLMPSAVIRANHVEELNVLSDNAAVVVGQLFAKVHMDGFNPIALVGGRGSQFFSWHAHSTGVVLAKDECYGLQFLTDAQIPDESVILCAGYSRRSALVDTVRSYKITIPLRGKT